MAQAVRRTQAERRAATLQRLLEAATESLAELGYTATTFAEVQRRAGVSNGALWHFWRSKPEMMAAVARHAQDVEVTAIGAPRGTAGQTLDAFVETEWAMLTQPGARAMHELVNARRSDLELRAAMAEVDLDYAESVRRRLTAALGPEITGHEYFERNLKWLAFSFSGLMTLYRPDELPSELLREVKAITRELFGITPAIPGRAESGARRPSPARRA